MINVEAKLVCEARRIFRNFKMNIHFYLTHVCPWIFVWGAHKPKVHRTLVSSEKIVLERRLAKHFFEDEVKKELLGSLCALPWLSEVAYVCFHMELPGFCMEKVRNNWGYLRKW